MVTDSVIICCYTNVVLLKQTLLTTSTRKQIYRIIFIKPVYELK